MNMNYSGIENCCLKLEACLARIKDIHDDCETQIGKIKGGSYWAGPASEGFVERAQKTINMSRNMETSLQNIIAYIRHCSANYKKVDDNIMKSLGNFKF